MFGAGKGAPKGKPLIFGLKRPVPLLGVSRDGHW